MPYSLFIKQIEGGCGTHLVVAVALACGLATSACAQAGTGYSSTPVFGGNGGGHFEGYCPRDTYLVGVGGRIGDWIDAIQPICAKWNSTTQAFNPPVTGPLSGGSGGGPATLMCPAGMVVRGWQIARIPARDEVVVKYIRPQCETFSPQHPLMSQIPGQFGGGGTAAPADLMRYKCPERQFANGIYGSSGAYVDNAGLRCEADPSLLGRPEPLPPGPVKSIGRVNVAPGPAGTPRSICDQAASARARNSPAASSLAAQCDAQRTAAEQKDLGPGPSGVPASVCDAAQDALTRDAPEAPDLVAKCRAIGGGQTLLTHTDQYAISGRAIASDDPMLSRLRRRQPDGLIRRGFDIAVAVTDKQTQWGPGKQKILDSLQPAEQEGFKVAASYILDRDRNTELVATGASIAEADALVGQMRNKVPDVRYWLGFDIASALFGNPALGGAGHKSMGPGAEKIRDELSTISQKGFNDSVQLHLSRTY